MLGGPTPEVAEVKGKEKTEEGLVQWPAYAHEEAMVKKVDCTEWGACVYG